MKKNVKNVSRRKFVKDLAGASMMASAFPYLMLNKGSKQKIILKPEPNPYADKKFMANDKIRVGVIGSGIIGFYNMVSALSVNGTEIAAVCDLYDGRLTRVKEVHGKDIVTTKDYHEILSRPDIDVVLIATPDHWHDRITVDALKAGKPVYCEKPMVQEVSEGHKVIAAEKQYKGKLQIGSQGVSSIIINKARELYKAGEIGELITVEAAYDRHSSLGAWQYSIPPDASPETIDFNTFLGDTPKVPFDPIRFFRWRNYQAYGTGIAGDLFVHLFSWTHRIIDSLGPVKIYGSGGTRYWKDGRDVPDILTCVVDYDKEDSHPPFNMQIRVNFTAGGGGEGSLKLVGSEGTLKYADGELTMYKTPFPNKPEYGGYDSLFTFAEATQKEFIADYNKKYFDVPPDLTGPSELTFKGPEGYDERDTHWANMIAAVREGKPIIENATYGLRAAGPALMSNMSYFDKKIVNWDPVNMVIKS